MPGRSRPPPTWTQLWLIAGLLADHQLPEMAVWVLVCFTTYFLPSDIFTLRVGDLLSPTRTLSSHAPQLHPQELEKPSKVGLFDDGCCSILRSCRGSLRL